MNSADEEIVRLTDELMYGIADRGFTKVRKELADCLDDGSPDKLEHQLSVIYERIRAYGPVANERHWIKGEMRGVFRRELELSRKLLRSFSVGKKHAESFLERTAAFLLTADETRGWGNQLNLASGFCRGG